VIAVSATVVGIILMAAYLVIPAAAARIWARSMASMTVIAILIGTTTTFAGVAGSYLFDVPTGSAIILTQAFVFVVAAFTQRRDEPARWHRLGRAQSGASARPGVGRRRPMLDSGDAPHTGSLPLEGDRRKRSVYAVLLSLALLPAAVSLIQILARAPGTRATDRRRRTGVVPGVGGRDAVAPRTPGGDRVPCTGVAAVLLLGNIGLRPVPRPIGPTGPGRGHLAAVAAAAFVFSTIAFDGDTSLRVPPPCWCC
jgi:hypothetical protein